MHRSVVIILIICILANLQGQLSGQVNQDGSKPQYLFPEFVKSTILMKNGQIKTSEMNYNIVTEKMVVFRDDTYYDLINPEMVDTVIINNYRFFPSGKLFFEVLVTGPLTLLIQNKGNLIPAGTPAAYGGTSQTANNVVISNVLQPSGDYNLDIPSNYSVRIAPVFWIRKDNEMFSFKTEKQFLLLFPGKENLIKSYMKENRLKFLRTDDLAAIVRYINTIK